MGAKIERWNWRYDQCQCHQWSWQSQSVSIFHFLCILWTIFDYVGRYPLAIRNFTFCHICRYILHAWSWYCLGHHQFDRHCHDSHQFRWNDVLVSCKNWFHEFFLTLKFSYLIKVTLGLSMGKKILKKMLSKFFFFTWTDLKSLRPKAWKSMI